MTRGRLGELLARWCGGGLLALMVVLCVVCAVMVASMFYRTSPTLGILMFALITLLLGMGAGVWMMMAEEDS